MAIEWRVCVCLPPLSNAGGSGLSPLLLRRAFAFWHVLESIWAGESETIAQNDRPCLHYTVFSPPCI